MAIKENRFIKDGTILINPNPGPDPAVHLPFLQASSSGGDQRRLAIFSPLEGEFPVADQRSLDEALGIFDAGRESHDSAPETGTDISTPFFRTEDAEADATPVQAQSFKDDFERELLEGPISPDGLFGPLSSLWWGRCRPLKRRGVKLNLK
ncbi:hypothetical protein GOODEAATRI_034372 [Goodea atripinnis]|uniref:Uncharacterized protein n=1 Tax=Goodea atripinnis TaxID=208336 RepID=A0ABV0PJI6_9TELE